MIPIEKNIIVTDVDGRRIGTTYPKRAKGLLKNGRAEYVNDREIRLTNTHASAVYTTEDETMSKVINFNTRDFVFDATCKVNRGFRGFITTPNGNEEIWEIGDWNWNWTQIITVLKGLEPDTDYVFRFAMTLGHNDDNREESLVNIFPAVPDADPNDPRPENHPDCILEEAARKKAWDERYTYCIKQSRFQPVNSKRDPEQDTMIRVFELPFRTDSRTEWKVMFVAQHAVARFFRAKDNEAYAGLEDLTYEQWREQRTKTLEAEREADIPDSLKKAIAIANGVSDGIGNGPVSKGSLNLSGAVIRKKSQFDKLVELAAGGMMINLSGAILECRGDDEDDEDEELDEDEALEDAEDFDDEEEEDDLEDDEDDDDDESDEDDDDEDEDDEDEDEDDDEK